MCLLARAVVPSHHIHGVLSEEGVDVGEGGAQLAVPVPAAQHELVETLGTYGRLVQIHLREKRERERGTERESDFKNRPVISQTNR